MSTPLAVPIEPPRQSATSDYETEEQSVFWRACERQMLELATSEVRPSVEPLEFAGISVHPRDAPQVIEEIAEHIADGKRLLLANHNLHSVYLHQRTSSVRAFYELADRVIIDGAPVLWMARRQSRDLTTRYRVGSTDWLGGFLQLADQRGLRVALLGGAPGVPERARDEILKRFPNIRFSVRHGHFDATRGSSENQAVLSWLGAFQPDLLLVGMGMPRQETWILENYDDVHATVTATVGGCLDYIAGEQELAPRWLGAFGLEWSYRLLKNPSRLWRRYLLEPPAVATEYIRENRRHRKARAEAA